MEAEIAHGSLALREEKQMVRDISRIKAQRERVREFEGRRGAVSWGTAEGGRWALPASVQLLTSACPVPLCMQQCAGPRPAASVPSSTRPAALAPAPAADPAGG